MVSIALLVTTMASSIGWLSCRVASGALVKYMKDKGYLFPSEKETKAYCTYALKKLLHIIGFRTMETSIINERNTVGAEKMLWAFEKDEKTETITITPMNDEKIIIHGKWEADMFCSFLNQCFQ